ncbi:hypothetical protein WJX84_005821 [Apatococcus fuscideae]|uniref:RecF/RecN/SMC N-terminal domain-containing protein n=1 Tax=Apatococcus fuscideae TaxID=2026836 RepID=A0AAW1SPD6_9CHLO
MSVDVCILCVQAFARQRQLALAEVQERAALLLESVQALEGGMHESEQHVLHANQDTFARIQTEFKAITHGLLPGLELTLEQVGEAVHQGVVFSFSRNGQEWQQGLTQLSGGQRSIVSLALIISAASAGTGTRVLLLDEVDAALDETNQRLVAGLLQVMEMMGFGI